MENIYNALANDFAVLGWWLLLLIPIILLACLIPVFWLVQFIDCIKSPLKYKPLWIVLFIGLNVPTSIVYYRYKKSWPKE